MNFIDYFKCIAAFAIHFITKRQDRQIPQAADFKQFPGLAFHAFCTIDLHHGRIYGGERAICVFGKIRVAGCVDQIKAKALKVE